MLSMPSARPFNRAPWVLSLIASSDITAVLLRDLHMTPSAPANLALPQPYLLFLGDITDAEYAKTAFGLRDWARERCVGEYACAGTTVTTGLPFLTPVEATTKGARALVIGVANEGGFIADAWMPALLSALEAGLDIISGMHTRLADIAPLEAAAAHNGRRLIDVRHPPQKHPDCDRAQAYRQKITYCGH